MKSSEIRQKARDSLKGLPGKYQLFSLPIVLAILSTSLTIHQTLVLLDGISVPTSANVFPFLVQVLLTLFLTAASFTMLDVLRHRRNSVGFADTNMIFAHEIFWKFLATIALRWFYIFMWSLIWIAGLLLLTLGSFVYFDGSNQISALILLLVGGAIYLFGLFMVIIKTYAYSLADYLLYDHLTTSTYTSPAQLLRESAQLMKGYKWKLFCLDMSFLGWYLLTAMTMGLLYVYVLPYSTTARVIFYDNRLAQLNHMQSITKEV